MIRCAGGRFVTRHSRFLGWVDDWAVLTAPDRVHWCDRSAEERVPAELFDEPGLLEKRLR